MDSNPKIPFLPGYNVNVDKKQNFHKSQIFNVKQGVRIDRDPNEARVPVDISGVTTQSLSVTKTADVERLMEDEKKDRSMGSTSVLPSWVAFDRKVLRFYCFFQEAIVASSVESERVRKCVMYYYLEDGTAQITEPKIENSGIPQGVFVKRHRVPKYKGDGVIGPEDLHIGAEVSVYGRVFRVVDADEFTRAFYDRMGRSLQNAEPYPVDSFTKKNTVVPETHHKLMHPQKEYMEARLGRTYNPESGLRRNAKNDGKVLRFFVLWDDQDLYGEKRPYILHYFLGDDTVEILEVRQANSGRDPFPAFLKRQKLPKNYKQTVNDLSSIGSRGDHRTNFYSPEDLRIGGIMEVYGRSLEVCGCDRFTKQYYMDTFGMQEGDFPLMEPASATNPPPMLPPPPHNGYGTEEDSLGSFLFLTPKVPKKNFKKFMDNDGVKLRFLARFVNPSASDVNRRFVVTYYPNDDTLGIFEQFDRNSGFVGGKFLERQRVKNPNTNDYLKAGDMRVGAIVNINKFMFELLDMDEYTRKFIQSNSAMFDSFDEHYAQTDV